MIPLFLSKASLSLVVAIFTMFGVVLYGSSLEHMMQRKFVWRSWTSKLVQELWICKICQPLGRQVCGYGLWVYMVYENTTKESGHCISSPNCLLVILPFRIYRCLMNFSATYLLNCNVQLKFFECYNLFALIILMCTNVLWHLV